ncbi:MAG: CoA transferase, partial [SAR202 cluster bacterium]|nr:CoA transferase [SAR202 cluster bacterium]
GPTAQALSGLTTMSGLPGHEPAGWGFSYMDHTAGYYGAMSSIMAMHHRNVTGEGQWIDMSQVESGIVLTAPAILDKTVNGRDYRTEGNPPGNRSPNPAVAPHNTYRCKGDDRWCVISVFDEDQWSALVAAIGSPDWTQNARFTTNEARVANQDDLDKNLEEWTIQRTSHEVMEQLQAAGVIAGAVQTAQEKVDEDPQLRAREFLPEADHAELGMSKVEGEPMKLSRSPWELQRSSPLLGEHIDYVYRELLGVDDAKLAQLVEEAAI